MPLRFPRDVATITPARPTHGFDDVLPVVLAGGRGSRLHELTDEMCKPAVPFAPGVRLVDFTMANVIRSRLPRAMVITQYLAETLEGHLGDTWAPHLPAGNLMVRNARRVAGRDEGAQGTADAVRVLVDEIDALAPREVLVLAADHVYAMDYRDMIATHRARGAVLSVAADSVPLGEASAFGILDADARGCVTHFVEKPADPPACPVDPTTSLASMGVYVISWPWLRALLTETPRILDFGHDVVPNAVLEGRCFAYTPGAFAPFYWRDVGTLDALRRAALDFAAPVPPFALGPIVQATEPPRGRTAFEMIDSLVMDGAMVSLGTRLQRVIVAPGAVVPFGTTVGFDQGHDTLWFRRTDEGTTLLTATMLAAHGASRAARSQSIH